MVVYTFPRVRFGVGLALSEFRIKIRRSLRGKTKERRKTVSDEA